MRGEPPGRSVDDGTFRVFAYGSLMWRPGFPHVRCERALLRGYHRAFCIRSRDHRGTPETPGLVLGLARGGACRGLVYTVADEDVSATRAYLDARELTTDAYVPRSVPVRIESGIVLVHTYVANPRHPDYVGDMDIEGAARIIVDASGDAGLNRDYLIETVRQLERDGFIDQRLHALLRRVERLTGELEAGGGI